MLPQEFRTTFLQIGRENRIRNMRTYVLTVLTDYQKYLEHEENRELDFVPQYYRSKQKTFEFFILYYFEQFFVTPLKMKIDATRWWLRNENVASVVDTITLLKHGGISDNYTLNNETIEIDERNYNELRSLFIAIGKGLIDENFQSL